MCHLAFRSPIRFKPLFAVSCLDISNRILFFNVICMETSFYQARNCFKLLTYLLFALAWIEYKANSDECELRPRKVIEWRISSQLGHVIRKDIFNLISQLKLNMI